MMTERMRIASGSIRLLPANQNKIKTYHTTFNLRSPPLMCIALFWTVFNLRSKILEQGTYNTGLLHITCPIEYVLICEARMHLHSA